VARRRSLSDQHLAAAYRRDARRLLIWLTRRTYDAQLAVDLVGETYARAWASRARFAGDPDDGEALAAWTFGIARHVLADALRRGRSERAALERLRVEPPQLAPDEIARLEELAELGSLRATLAVALEDLSPEQRDAVRLRVVDELDYPAIARRLGISEDAVRARVSRGLRTLAVAMEGGAA
jgi:RNA polymerase sigma-70 factor (ECF subfamily)